MSPFGRSPNHYVYASRGSNPAVLAPGQSSPHPRTGEQPPEPECRIPCFGDPNSSAANRSVRVSRCDKEQQQGERKMNGTREHFPNGPHAPSQGHHDENTAPTEAEVQTIVQSIRDASAATCAATTSLPSPEPHSPQDPTPSQPPRPGEFDVGEYWDLASMAPLNQVSRVST